MEKNLIAPCGMNCGICSGFLANKNKIKEKGVKLPYCTGCRIMPRNCAWLKKICPLIAKDKIKFCFECPDFPCKRLVHLDNRYKTNFRMSMLDNLKFIKEKGIEKFLADQRKKWQCPKCSEMISCHNGLCFNCDLEKLKNKKIKNRW